MTPEHTDPDPQDDGLDQAHPSQAEGEDDRKAPGGADPEPTGHPSQAGGEDDDPGR